MALPGPASRIEAWAVAPGPRAGPFAAKCGSERRFGFHRWSWLWFGNCDQTVADIWQVGSSIHACGLPGRIGSFCLCWSPWPARRLVQIAEARGAPPPFLVLRTEQAVTPCRQLLFTAALPRKIFRLHLFRFVDIQRRVSDVTLILQRIEQGDPRAADELLPLVYDELRKAELVKLRYFVGLTIEEAAQALGISAPTAKRDWTYARAWLFREIRPGE